MRSFTLSTAVISLMCGAAAVRAVAVYGQCGGIGYTGSTTCDSGSVCTYQNDYYSQCLPGTATGTTTTKTTTTTSKAGTTTTTTKSTTTTTKTTTTTTKTTTTTSSSATGTLPSTFTWSSSGPLIGPKSDSHALTALKDPSIVYYNGKYHVFASTISASAGYNLVYMNFADFSAANSSTFYYLDATPIGTGYRAAPQVFFHTPSNLWYLVYQDGGAGYSTNTAIDNPNGWSAPKHFWSSEPAIITSATAAGGGWLDMWVICDSSNCYHFSSDDLGNLYRASTTLANFPNGFSQPVIALSDSKYNLFEASNIYHVNNEYLLIVECIGSDGRRYFRSWTSTSLGGSWTPLAATQSNPFAGAANVVFPGGVWTKDISHGEMIRTNVDQTMTISPCNLRYLYQGIDPSASGDYNSLPWRLALLTQTNSSC